MLLSDGKVMLFLWGKHHSNSHIDMMDFIGESFGNNGKGFESFIEYSPDH